MGGDFGPVPNLAGAALALAEYPHIEKLFLVGRPDELQAELSRIRLTDGRLEIVAASEVVDMHDSAVSAIRRKKDSSIAVATEMVRDGRADAVVSAGHTGAAVAASTLKLRTLPGIDRAGILTPFPNEAQGVCYLIDAGANVDSRPEHLVQQALMGWTYVKHVHGRENPAVGLMSNGEEESKGNEVTKDVFARLAALRPLGLNFIGNIEGRDLLAAPVDVAVCDGFVGNVLLKGCEGTAKAFARALKSEVTASPWRKLLAAMLRPAFKGVHARMSYETYGGSPLLGVNGVTIIAHGSSNAVAIKNALRVAAEAISHRVNPHITESVTRFLEPADAPAAPPTASTHA
jgi:glycerol-3-phosphate acyltransferase PlsX